MHHPRGCPDHTAIGETFQKCFNETFFTFETFSYIALNLKSYTMSQPIQFPQIPDDPHSLILLENLAHIAARIHNDGPIDIHAAKCGAFLHFLSSAPREADYLYFKVHSDTRAMCHSLSEHYNYYIHSQGDEYKLKVLNEEIGSFSEYFNEFQIALYYIDLKAKEDKRWIPLSDLIWGFYCSLYSMRKSEDFLDRVRQCLENTEKHS